MKRALSILVSILIFVFTFCDTACAVEVSLSAQAYVLYCVENEEILLSKNAHKRMKNASTTKIMTTLLALEESEKNDALVQFKENMVAEGSSMYLKAGDTVHLSDLAVGMMMASGNDAANAVAITLGGSIEKFSKLMNSRAKEIGMNNTHFVTPSGLDDDNHYSTCVDMAKLMSVALKNKQFAQISKNTSMTVDFLTPQKSVTYHNHNRLLSLYEHCISGKTGFTKSAGRCLVSAAKKDSVTLVAVTFNAPSDWSDHMALYDYGFERLSAACTDDTDEEFFVKVVGADKETLQLYTKNTDVAVINKEDINSIKRTVYAPSFLYAPIKRDDYVGVVTYTLNDEIIAQNPLFATENIDLSQQKGFLGFLRRLFS